MRHRGTQRLLVFSITCAQSERVLKCGVLGDCLHHVLVKPPPTKKNASLGPIFLCQMDGSTFFCGASHVLHKLPVPLSNHDIYPSAHVPFSKELLGSWTTSPPCTSMGSVPTRGKAVTPLKPRPTRLLPAKKLIAIVPPCQASCPWGVECHCSTCSLR